MKPQEVAEMIDKWWEAKLYAKQLWKSEEKIEEQTMYQLSLFKSYNLQSLWITVTCKREKISVKP